MSASEHLLLGFHLRQVRVGVQVTFLVLAALAAYPLLGTPAEVATGAYFAVIGVAAAGAAGVAALPWRRLFLAGWGYRMLGAWSVLDILLITALVAASGGGDSELYAVYVLTTIFFAASYPPRLQAALLAFTYAAYAPVAYLIGGLQPGVLVLRLGLLASVAVMVGFLSVELLRNLTAHHQARAESDRRADLLATVAAAGRNLNTLDPDRVLDVVMDAAVDLGFEATALSLLDDAQTYTIVRAHGLPAEYAGSRHDATTGLVAAVLERGDLVTNDDYATVPDSLPSLEPLFFRSVANAPIRVRDRIVAVLGAGTRAQRALTREELEALELLATQAGRALDNAHRFADEHRAVRRLEELDRLKNDFLSNVSHELRTPLTVIRGMTDTLTRRWEQLGEAQRQDLLQRVDTNAGTLEQVLAILLDFSRIQAGRLEPRLTAFDASDLVLRTAERLRGLFADRSIRVDAEPALTVAADPELIDRVLENLMSNAVKHTVPGCRIEVSVRSDGNGGALVTVSDDGPGIPEDELAHLGERFFRGGDPDTRATRGLGLGLALVEEILAQHHSTLVVSSTVGEGSTFAFTLPAVHDLDDAN